MRLLSAFSAVVGLLLACIVIAQTPAPVPPGEAAARMTLPEGFRATLFAGEPDLVQPIAFTTDERGRLWVVECMSYPHWIRDGKEGKDRVLILEDTDGDGRFDKRTIFADKLANLSGIAVGHGGVWLCATPNLIFIPKKADGDAPAGPPEVMLDGWSLDARHNVFAALGWGPDGWLYGCNGIIATSKIGRPGTPDKDRTPLNCGVWRFHPTRKVFEPVAWGTTNPWGLDWDDYGQMFITNCVIPHLFHVVPGAHFQRMYGQNLNAHTYGLLSTCADHIHWGGGAWTSSRGGKGAHSDAGGGHAHAGAMVYLGDNWPDRYRNGVFLCNIHGSRVNHDILERNGSSYVARHGKDFLLANDPWFRGLNLTYGPDGGVFVSDWCDDGECHDYDKVHISGRIFKVTYGQPKFAPVDLAKLSDAELVKLQLHKNDWHVRQARRLLQERAVAKKLRPETVNGLHSILESNPDVTRQLRALWALHAIGALDAGRYLDLLNHGQEHVRAWVIALALESRQPGDALRSRLELLAKSDPSPSVRLAVASGLQRLPTPQRWPIVHALAARAEDANDPYLPLMLWYGIEAAVPGEPAQTVQLLERTRIPLLREHLARRLTVLPAAGSVEAPGLTPVVAALAKVDEPALHRDVLRGVQEALKGRRQAQLPAGWAAVYPRLAESPLPEVRERAVALAVLFGDEQALATLRKLTLDSTASAAARLSALQNLLYKQKPDLVPLLQGLLNDPAVRGGAIRGLASFNDPATPALLVKLYASLPDDEKADAIATLASRPAYALALLDAIDKKQIGRNDLSAFTARQLLGLNSAPVADRLKQVWGEVRPASAEKAALMTKWKTQLTASELKKGNRGEGRAVFAKNCAACHKLFGEGGDIGPELTGAQRTNLDYVLENVLDPSAVVPGDWQVTVIATKSGRVLTGAIRREDDKTVTVQTQNEVVILPRDEIEMREKTKTSLMPEGLFDKLSKDEVRDLVAYLASQTQVALPGGKK